MGRKQEELSISVSLWNELVRRYASQMDCSYTHTPASGAGAISNSTVLRTKHNPSLVSAEWRYQVTELVLLIFACQMPFQRQYRSCVLARKEVVAGVCKLSRSALWTDVQRSRLPGGSSAACSAHQPCPRLRRRDAIGVDGRRTAADQVHRLLSVLPDRSRSSYDYWSNNLHDPWPV
jgi:hypothetical protein